MAREDRKGGQGGQSGQRGGQGGEGAGQGGPEGSQGGGGRGMEGGDEMDRMNMAGGEEGGEDQGGEEGGGRGGGGVDLNTASEDELRGVLGDHANRTQDIIRARPIRSWDDVKRIGLNERAVDQMRKSGVTFGGAGGGRR